MSTRFSILLPLLFFIQTAYSQTNKADLSFIDAEGHRIEFHDSSSLIEAVGSDFLMKNISASNFGIVNSDQKFTISIKTDEVKSNNKYILEVRKTPHTKDIEVVIRYLGGWQYYKLKLRKRKGEIRKFDIRYMYSII